MQQNGWRPRLISLEKINQYYTAQDIHAVWIENNQNLCTTVDGFHPPENVWGIITEGARGQPAANQEEFPPDNHQHHRLRQGQQL
jgi:hypothetical protein